MHTITQTSITHKIQKKKKKLDKMHKFSRDSYDKNTNNQNKLDYVPHKIIHNVDYHIIISKIPPSPFTTLHLTFMNYSLKKKFKTELPSLVY